MSPPDLSCIYRFNPVGQGLFASGALVEGSFSRFVWAFDCGTSSSQRLLDQPISHLVGMSPKSSAGSPELGMVALSHFDQDHISGILRLLSRVSVDTLVLPYVPLSLRMAIAFNEGVDTQQDVMGFFVNPVEYLLRRQAVSIRRIVLVPPSDFRESDWPPDEESPRIGVESVDGGPWTVFGDAVRPRRNEEEATTDLEAFQSSAGSTLVQFLRAGSSLAVNALWEFVPYNDAHVKPRIGAGPLAQFRQRVVNLRDKLIGTTSSPADKKKALLGLRNEYDKRFGKTGYPRNVISLFMYGGPLRSKCEPVQTTYVEHETKPASRARVVDLIIRTHEKCSVLYTGDGFLDTNSRLDQLCKWITDDRVEQIACLQVMHHGARANWCSSVPQRLDPDVSVFSSDPTRSRPRHPHAEVVRSFLEFGPVQVHQRRWLRMRTELVFL